jgi:glycosyltransferase involved in cell wall biosynthesis
MKQYAETDQPMFSIIICLHKICDRFYKDLKKFKFLKYPNYEIIIIPNKGSHVDIQITGVRIVIPKRKNISLGEKRNIGWQNAKGKYCAYIDDDAYPRRDWLLNAYKIFLSNNRIGAVGGPNLTPPEDPYWAKIGGHILESYVTSGAQQVRYVPLKRAETTELQGVNMIIPKLLLKKLGGFQSMLYSGDDSTICSDIRSHGYKIISDPKVIVYHHRRAFPQQHLNQISSMGKHRGFFVKAYPDTLAPLYFVPLILTFGLVTWSVACYFVPILRMPFLSIFLLFYGLGYLSSLRAGYINAAIVSVGIILTHMTYGLSFLIGMLRKTYISK